MKAQAAMWRNGLNDRIRLLLVPALLLSIFGATLMRATPAAAEATVGNCQKILGIDSFETTVRAEIGPYGNICYGIYLRDGYLYSIDVNAEPRLGCNPQRPCRDLRDSTLTLYAHNYHGMFFGLPPYDASDYSQVASNDDIAYPTNLSSRIIYAHPGSVAANDYGMYIIEVAGYGASAGWFELTVHESLQMAEPPCQTFWC